MNKKTLKFLLSFIMVSMIILSGRYIENVFADSVDPNDYIKNINIIDKKGEKESWFNGYKIEDNKMKLLIQPGWNFQAFLDPEGQGWRLDDCKLVIETDNVGKIKVDNKYKGTFEGIDGEFEGIKNYEKSSVKWAEGIFFGEFGTYVEDWGGKVSAFTKDAPPEFTFTTRDGQSFTLPWEVVEHEGDDEEDIKFEAIISANSNNRNVDKEIEVGVLVDNKLLGEQRVELEPEKPYTIQAKDGTRTKFKEWKLETNYIDDLEDNFEKYFGGKKTDKNLQFTLTEELIEKLKKLPEHKRYIDLEANYDEYTSVEIELKEELKTTDLLTMTKRSINMMEYSMETEEYKDKMKLLKNNINNNYTHKLDDNMGQAYIILKDKDGKLKEKFSSSLNEDIILAYSSIPAKESDIAELIAIPKEGYEFEKWQIITPAMDMETEWGIEPQYLNPESGVFCEIKSPYIKTELQAMQNKGEGHIKRFRARAIFKSINEGEQKEIDTIKDIHKEYIKGYTDISDVFPKTVEVKFKDSDEKVAIAVDWEAVDLESIASGENIITGKLTEPRFSEKEAKLYLNVKEIRGFKELTQKASLINSNFFTGSGKFHKLPKKVEVKIFDGEKENIVELDAKWNDKELSEDRSYEVKKGRIFFYKHGKFMATGRVKGCNKEIEYELEVMPGNKVMFLIDDNFKKSGNGYVYNTLNLMDIKKGELISEPKEIPKRPGYIFVGWYRDASWTDPLDLNQGRKTDFPQILGDSEMTGSSFSLYNKWRELFIETIEDIQIELGSQLPDKITINTTDKDILEIDVKEWKQEGVDLSQPGKYTVKSIIEWKLEEEEFEVTVIVKDKVVEEKEFTIEFNSNGGTEIDSMIVKENQTIGKPTDPIREGHKFIGWYSDEGLTKKFDFNTEIREDITIYAKWEKDAPIQEKLEIKSVELIEKEGRIISTGIIKDKAITLKVPKGYNEDLNIGQHILKITGTEKTRISQDRGYDGSIEEWADGQVSNSIRVGESKKFTIYKGDKSVDYTIEILTEKEPTPPQEDKYTVTFNTNGGSKIKQIKVKRDEKISRPIDPTKENNKFIGWYEDSNFSNVFSFKTAIKEDITLYAKWEKIKINIESIPEIINEVKLGTAFELPKRVQVTMSDKSSRFIDVESWNPSTTNTSKVGTFNFEGNIKGTDKKVKLILNVKDDKAKDDTTKSFPRITRFSLLGYEASIDDENKRIIVSLPYNINLRSLVPDITTVESNSISPSKGSAVNFNSTVNYTVYGEDNTKKTYRVIVDMPSERDSYYWDDYYKRRRDDYYDRRSRVSWWELAEDAKERRERKEERAESAKDRRLVRKERYKILNDVGKIISSARNSRSSLMINENNNYIEIIPTIADFKSGFNNIITIPKDVLSDLPKGEYDFIKYSTGIVNIEIYPFMEAASGLKLNLCDVPRNIKDKWNKIKGKGYVFQVESSSTKGGLSYELNLEKLYPAEKLRFVKYDYMKGDFADLPPEKWYVFGGKLRCEKVSAGIYGIIYKD